MKICTGCNKNKSLSSFQFVKRKTRKPDYYSKCKSCWSIQQHERYLTPKGRAESCWKSILSRVENRDGVTPTYKNIKLKISRKDFFDFFISEVTLFIKKYPNEIPTIDRIDNNCHYEIGNLQILSKKENTLKRPSNKRLHSPKGLAWCYRCKKYLPSINFHKSKHTTNGYCGQCKKCGEFLRKRYQLSLKSKSNSSKFCDIVFE